MSREILNWDVMTDQIGCVSPAYQVYRINSDIINPIYLKYYIQSNIDYFSDLIKPGSREGQGIDKGLLMQKNIYLPPLNDYYKIINKFNAYYKQLSDLENKIATIRNECDSLLINLISNVKTNLK